MTGRLGSFFPPRYGVLTGFVVLRERLSAYRDRARRDLTTAITEDYTPHEVALSFAVGIFVTTLPSGGLGIGLLIALAYWLAWASKAAMIAAVAVLNPFVKPVVYVASYQLGVALLGTEPLFVVGHSTLDAALTAVQFLLFGNVLLALALSAVGYVTVFRLTRTYLQRRGASWSTGASVGRSLFGRRKR